MPEQEQQVVARAHEQPGAGHLPHAISPLIGRTQELEALAEALQHARLVTLTGPGGCGKTRLALEAAQAFVRTRAQPVWFVELAALSDPAFLAATVASTMGLREYAGRTPMEILFETFSQQQGLLILDNCEHLIDACALFAQNVLTACSQIVVLATSREALMLAGEQLIRVPALAFPDPDHLPPLEALAHYDAVRLFLDRARLVVSTFTLSQQNAHALARICQQLDGLPLALELAAARVQLLALDDLAARLEKSFRLLAGGNRTLLPRQRALQATMAWSYDLLSEQERLLFARLSVFAGSFQLSAAEAVCAGSGLAPEEVLEIMSRLISKSLVHVLEQGNQVRYRLLETVRQYAREKLEASGEVGNLHRRHATFFLDVVQRAEPHLRSAYRQVWLQSLEQEHDNLRAAMRWALEQGENALALHLMGLLAWFWYFRGHLSEARQWYQEALAAASSQQPTKERAVALFGAGALAWMQGELAQAQTYLEESVELWRTHGDAVRLGYSQALCGLVTCLKGDYQQALARVQESLVLLQGTDDVWGLALSLHWQGDIWRHLREDSRAAPFYQQSQRLFLEAGDQWGVALTLQGLGGVAYRLQQDALARTFLEECLALRRRDGDQWLTALTLAMLGYVTHRQGDALRAIALFEESLALYRMLVDLAGISTALQQLAVLALKQGVPQQATMYWQERLLLSQKQGHTRHLVECLQGLAEVAAVQHNPLRAARLLGAAEHLRPGVDPFRARISRETLSLSVDGFFDESIIHSAWEAGNALSIEQALDEALIDLPARFEITSSPPFDKVTPPVPAGLSKRQVQILRLIAEGKSNRMIAQVLGITEKTVINHVTTIYNKTGCNNRATATVFALRQGLA